jgi:hypothetical protein
LSENKSRVKTIAIQNIKQAAAQRDIFLNRVINKLCF